MKKHFRKVLEALKTSKDIKALGFSRRELKGVAAKIADKLDSEIKEDATDDEIQEAVDDAIDAALPFLQFSQTVSERRVQSYKEAHPANEEDDEEYDDDDDEPATRKNRKSQTSKKGKKSEDEDGEESSLAKALKPLMDKLDGMQSEITALKSGKTADSRKAKLEKLLKNTGKFGERTLKAFNRMSFKDDEEFEDFYDEVEADLETENQERANRGLDKLGAPDATAGAANKRAKKNDEEVMSDDEVKELAKL
ncbi:hypothetical protein [Prevotella sp. KH2C16]|uniref:hypothetical protein n=1 Tax=Prevotella sp. KH2C16 TaxID=1855325 RepID=UPI0008F23403|nr:hypothetical protein [Prevotella sp. KH2C16]SFG56808.1 hypothetical protein SAMN05216383_12070 [Prevotella sp. KH2C16]